MKCCWSCSRLFLVVFSLLSIAVGLAVVGGILWLRLDANIEHALRAALADEATTPAEMYELKTQFRFMGLITFWLAIAFGVCVTLLGLIGMCGSLALSRTASGVYATAVLLLVAVEVAVVAMIAFYRGVIGEAVARYLAVAYQYNLEDSVIIHDRFHCCGDGTNASYNFQCQGLQQPSCMDVFGALMNFGVWAGGAVFLAFMAVQLLMVIFSCVIVVGRKYRTLNESTESTT